jgi:hypothetical protein
MSETNFNPFDQSNYSESPSQEVNSQATETELKTEETGTEVSEPTQTETSVESPQEFNEASETVLSEPSEEENEEDSGFVFEWPNETARDIYNNLVTGNISDLADMIYEQKVLSSLDSMSDSDIVKLKMAYDYPDLTPEEIEEEFSSKFSVDDDADRMLMSDEEITQHNKKIERASKAMARELKKEVGAAKDYLSSMREEISFPDILSQIQNLGPQTNPEEVLNEFFQVQEAEDNKLYEQARQQYVSSLSDGLKQFDGFNVSYKDEDVQFDGKYSLTPEEKAGLTDSLQQFDLEEFYGARYYKDGKYDTKQLAEDVYFLQNRDKIVNSLITQAVSKSKSDLLKAMKNIDYNDSPRVGASSSSNNDYDAMVAKLFSL